MSETDRHKKARLYCSGAQKRKVAKQRSQKETEALSKTRKLTDFMTQPQLKQSDSLPVPSTSTSSVSVLTEAVRDVNTEEQIETSSTDVHVSDSTEEVDEIDTTDVALWPDKPTQELIHRWAVRGSGELQNLNDNLFKQKSVRVQVSTESDSSTRICTSHMFHRRSKNGEIVNRSWLCFSPSEGTVYCYVCKLMSAPSSQLTHGGYSDWRHASSRLAEHEQSKSHVEATFAVVRRAQELGRIDCDLAKQMTEEVKYWRSVLKRVVSVITFISERGLAFRGTNEILGKRDNGNYLGILELLAQYDDFLAQHLREHGGRGSGHISYLSSTICEELISQMSDRVLQEIVSRIKVSKYYSISLDSSPDEGHIDQLTVVFRYMENASPVERFVTFMPNRGHKALDMFNALNEFLQSHDIDISDCRGQSYDNASSMSGKYNGLQAVIRQKNPHALWVPCAGHSLNLVGKTAAESCTSAVSFFDFLQQVYVFFTASTRRYDVLIKKLQSAEKALYVPKKLSETRWSCRADATRALACGFGKIKEALSAIGDDEDEKVTVRTQADALHERMSTLEVGLYAVFWNDVLGRFNATSKTLQDPKLDINAAIALLKSLQHFILSKRDSFDEYEQQGSDMSGTSEYAQSYNRARRRSVRQSPLDYGQTPEVELSPSDRFRTQSFLPVIDQLDQSLTQRIAAYDAVSRRFGFLGKLNIMTAAEIQSAATDLVATYSDDLEDCLGNELVQFAELSNVVEDEGKDLGAEHLLYTTLVDKRLQSTFPNVEIALRMYLVLMSTNCTSERTFSKMKLIKNRLRATMTSDRLSDLALLSIESDVLREIQFDDILNDFATRKARKVHI